MAKIIIFGIGAIMLFYCLFCYAPGKESRKEDECTYVGE